MSFVTWSAKLQTTSAGTVDRRDRSELRKSPISSERRFQRNVITKKVSLFRKVFSLIDSLLSLIDTVYSFVDIFFTKWQAITAGKDGTGSASMGRGTGWVLASTKQNPFGAARRVPAGSYLSSSRLFYQLSSELNESVQDAAVDRPYISISHLSSVEFN